MTIDEYLSNNPYFQQRADYLMGDGYTENQFNEDYENYTNSLGDFLFGGYSKVPGTDPSEYSLLDPQGWTAAMFGENGSLNAAMDNMWNGYTSQLGNMQNALGMFTSPNSMYNQIARTNQALVEDPNYLTNQLMNTVQPWAFDSAQGALAPYKEAAGDLYSNYTLPSTMDAAASNTAGFLGTSLFDDRLARTMQEGAAQHQADLEGKLMGLGQFFTGQGMNAASQGYQGALSGQQGLMGLLGQNALGQAGMHGNLAGNLMSSYANTLANKMQALAPTYAAPQYQNNPGFLDQLLGMAPTIATTLAGLPPIFAGGGGGYTPPPGTVTTPTHLDFGGY